MARPRKCRFVSQEPGATYFKPRGIPMTDLQEVVLGVDELEAVRLSDLEGLYQEAAALRMKVSRQTFANILHGAHAKIAEAVVRGKALRIEGGTHAVVEGPEARRPAAPGRGVRRGRGKGGPGGGL